MYTIAHFVFVHRVDSIRPSLWNGEAFVDELDQGFQGNLPSDDDYVSSRKRGKKRAVKRDDQKETQTQGSDAATVPDSETDQSLVELSSDDSPADLSVDLPADLPANDDETPAHQPQFCCPANVYLEKEYPMMFTDIAAARAHCEKFHIALPLSELVCDCGATKKHRTNESCYKSGRAWFFAQNFSRIGHDEHWRPGSYNYDAGMSSPIPLWVPAITHLSSSAGSIHHGQIHETTRHSSPG